MNNEKIVLLFPDGVGIRNYLYTDVFKGLKQSISILLIKLRNEFGNLLNRLQNENSNENNKANK